LRNNIPIESKKSARERLGLPDCLTILSAGGSQGAQRLNEAVAGLLTYEQKIGSINHIHGYGKHGKDTFMEKIKELGVDEKNPHFILKEYIDNMYTCMCAADLIITRAGAMTLTEIMAIGRASVLVPYPYAAENHQYYNALTLQDADAGRIINDKELTSEKLIAVVKELCGDNNTLLSMSQNAASLGVKNAAELCLDEIKVLMGL
jgi:UDP-N-acetylglucosamine--N-acetylmuramyl-(pentapeptide) pyrophosphoryl-undecaprenol N-acetylglucosamine transferase